MYRPLLSVCTSWDNVRNHWPTESSFLLCEYIFRTYKSCSHIKVSESRSGHTSEKSTVRLWFRNILPVNFVTSYKIDWHFCHQGVDCWLPPYKQRQDSVILWAYIVCIIFMRVVPCVYYSSVACGVIIMTGKESSVEPRGHDTAAGGTPGVDAECWLTSIHDSQQRRTRGQSVTNRYTSTTADVIYKFTFVHLFWGVSSVVFSNINFAINKICHFESIFIMPLRFNNVTWFVIRNSPRSISISVKRASVHRIDGRKQTACHILGRYSLLKVSSLFTQFHPTGCPSFFPGDRFMNVYKQRHIDQLHIACRLCAINVCYQSLLYFGVGQRNWLLL